MASGNITNQIRAEHLSGEHLDCNIEFDWVFPNSRVKARVSGILKRVEHNSGYGTTVEIFGPEALRDNQDGHMATPFYLGVSALVMWTTNNEFMGQ